MSKIEWTERSWNPIVGCSKVSEGCKNCYAIRMAWRLMHNPKTADRYAGTVHKTCGGKANWTGVINVLSDVALLPLQVKKPTMWFVNSMSDLFHEQLDDDTIIALFDIMRDCPRHTFQVVTKRTARAAEFLRKHYPEPLPNVWIGFSVENNKTLTERAPYFQEFEAAVKFISCEPLLGPLSFKSPCLSKHLQENLLVKYIDWVIVGGESGPDARPMNPDWVCNLRDECTAAGVPFFFKQWGEWAPLQRYYEGHLMVNLTPGKNEYLFNDGNRLLNMQRVGKKAAGRLLNGREWNEMPKGNFSPVKNVGDE